MRYTKNILRAAVVAAILLPAVWAAGCMGAEQARLADDELAAVLQTRAERWERRNAQRQANTLWPSEVAGRDGSVWFVPRTGHGNDPRMSWRMEGEARVDVGTLPVQGMRDGHQVGVVLPDGRLLVVWTEVKRIYAAVNSGSEWSEPVTVIRFDPCSGQFITGLDVALDAAGRANLVFLAPLTPEARWSYPFKCWHAVFDGQRWSTPVPIQREEAFLREPELTLAPTGRLILSVSRGAEYAGDAVHLAVKTLDDKGRWSGLTKIQSIPAPKGPNINPYTVAAE
jgi:hypothetical protein